MKSLSGPLSLGLAVSLAALALFAVLTVTVPRHTGTDFDLACARAMKEHAQAHPELLAVMRLVTHLGGVPFIVGLSVLGAVVLFWRHHRLLALGWAVAAAGGGLLNISAKHLIGRDRPAEALQGEVIADEAVTEHNASFPSGHSMGSAIAYGMLGYVAVRLQQRRAERAAVIACLAVLVLLIGFSRIYLRAHWFTDVVGGFAIGTSWVALCITWLEVTRRRQVAANLAPPPQVLSGHVENLPTPR
jgi:undecaprenyl-diphosphatase